MSVRDDLIAARLRDGACCEKCVAEVWDPILAQHAHELADRIVAASMAECTDLDCEQTMCGGAAMRHAAILIRPEVTT